MPLRAVAAVAVERHEPPRREVRLAVRGLSMRYPNGHLALSGLDVDVHAHELLVILGSNGSGKSTLLKSVVGLQRPTAGSVELGGCDLARLSGEALRQARLPLALISQRPNLVARRSVIANVCTGSLGRHLTVSTALGWLPKSEMAACHGYLAEVGLETYAQQRAGTLSGGQAQRVAIARALAQRPRVLLADEPVASLDPEAADDVMRLLRRLATEDGLAVVCVLHQPELALRYADRILGLRAGEAAFQRPVADLTSAEIAALYTTQ